MKRLLIALTAGFCLFATSTESQAQDVTSLLPIAPAESSANPLNLGSLLEAPLTIIAPVAQEEADWINMEVNWIAGETNRLTGDAAETYFNLNPITNTAESMGLFDRRPILSLFGR